MKLGYSKINKVNSTLFLITHLFLTAKKNTREGVWHYISKTISLFYIRDDMTVTKDKLIESPFIDVHLNKKETVTIGTIYRSPCNDSKTSADFLANLKPILQAITNSKLQTFILGDLNFNLLDYDDSNFHTFVDTMYENGFYSLISKPTRITTHSATLIDHAWTNIFNYPIHSGIIVDSIADHMPIILSIQLKSPYVEDIHIKQGQFSSANTVSLHYGRP